MQKVHRKQKSGKGIKVGGGETKLDDTCIINASARRSTVLWILELRVAELQKGTQLQHILFLLNRNASSREW